MRLNNLFKVFLLLGISFSLSNAVDTGPMNPSGNNPKAKGIKKPPKIEESKAQFDAELNYDKTVQRTKEYTITQMQDEDFGYIDIPNLKIGISGIVINKKDTPMVIAIASVVQSDDKRSKLEFKKYTDLKQDAIPMTNLKVSKGDKVILKYLYEASIVIAPNIDSFLVIRNKLRDYNFLHPDLFSSFLKVNESPIPTKELMQQFAIEQNLGSLVLIIEKKAYLLDSRTFKIVDSFDISYENEKKMTPFYTRVKKIETGSFDFSSESIGEYTKYYKELLDIK